MSENKTQNTNLYEIVQGIEIVPNAKPVKAAEKQIENNQKQLSDPLVKLIEERKKEASAKNIDNMIRTISNIFPYPIENHGLKIQQLANGEAIYIRKFFGYKKVYLKHNNEILGYIPGKWEETLEVIYNEALARNATIQDAIKKQKEKQNTDYEQKSADNAHSKPLTQQIAERKHEALVMNIDGKIDTIHKIYPDGFKGGLRVFKHDDGTSVIFNERWFGGLEKVYEKNKDEILAYAPGKWEEKLEKLYNKALTIDTANQDAIKKQQEKERIEREKEIKKNFGL